MRQSDGRSVYLYGAHTGPPAGYQPAGLADGVYQRRWNPLRQEWILVAASRQARTFLPEKAACPLCPSTREHHSEIPATQFQVAVFENRFPAMRSEARTGNGNRKPKTLISTQSSAGVCEVVVYSDRHDASFSTLSLDALHHLVDVWTDRYCELGSRRDVRYVFIFENRGEAVGVTLHHPHGQIYGYPFVPPVPDTELGAGRAFTRERKGCLHCALVAEEQEAEARLLFTRGGIAAYVPAYARWPYEVHVAPVEHRGALPDLPADDRSGFGEALQMVTQAYDRLFDVPMPYMMAMHQRPTDGRAHPEAHLHVEFYPVLRNTGRLKYLAAGECGAGSFVSDSLPEEKAAELRRVLPQ